MKNLLKHSMVAVATMALAGSVYAIPTLVVTDGSGISAIQTSASGVVTISTSDGDWSVVVSTGISSPPAIGQGTASEPVMDLAITATYIGNGTAGNPLTISFGSDAFGPSSGSVIAELTGHVVSGTGNAVGFTTVAASGSVLPTTTTPKIPGTTLTSTSIPNLGGAYSSFVLGGPLNLSSYSLDEVVTLTGNAGGSSYSIDASLTSVPDGGMTLVLLGSALSGLALIKRKLA
jgi:VPDSG-CTERM motif